MFSVLSLPRANLFNCTRTHSLLLCLPSFPHTSLHIKQHFYFCSSLITAQLPDFSPICYTITFLRFSVSFTLVSHSSLSALPPPSPPSLLSLSGSLFFPLSRGSLGPLWVRDSFVFLVTRHFLLLPAFLFFLISSPSF